MKPELKVLPPGHYTPEEMAAIVGTMNGGIAPHILSGKGDYTFEGEFIAGGSVSDCSTYTMNGKTRPAPAIDAWQYAAFAKHAEGHKVDWSKSVVRMVSDYRPGTLRTMPRMFFGIGWSEVLVNQSEIYGMGGVTSRGMTIGLQGSPIMHMEQSLIHHVNGIIFDDKGNPMSMYKALSWAKANGLKIQTYGITRSALIVRDWEDPASITGALRVANTRVINVDAEGNIMEGQTDLFNIAVSANDDTVKWVDGLPVRSGVELIENLSYGHAVGNSLTSDQQGCVFIADSENNKRSEQNPGWGCDNTLFLNNTAIASTNTPFQHSAVEKVYWIGNRAVSAANLPGHTQSAHYKSRGMGVYWKRKDSKMNPGSIFVGNKMAFMNTRRKQTNWGKHLGDIRNDYDKASAFEGARFEDNTSLYGGKIISSAHEIKELKRYYETYKDKPAGLPKFQADVPADVIEQVVKEQQAEDIVKEIENQEEIPAEMGPKTPDHLPDIPEEVLALEEELDLVKQTLQEFLEKQADLSKEYAVKLAEL